MSELQIRNIDLTIVKFDIERKISNSSILNATVKLLIDEWSEVYDWSININSCKIKLYSVSSWKEDEATYWDIRNELFKIISSLSGKRLTQLTKEEWIQNGMKNKYHEVRKNDREQLRILSNFCTKRIKTLQSIVPILFGRSPTGELTMNWYAEIKAITRDKKSVPFYSLVNFLSYKTRGKVFSLNTVSEERIPTIDFTKWMDNNRIVREWHSMLYSDKSNFRQEVQKQYLKHKNQKYSSILKNLFFKQQEIQVKTKKVISNEIDQLCMKKRFSFKKEVMKKYNRESIHSNFNYVHKNEYEYAHLKSVSSIKKECIEAWERHKEDKHKAKNRVKQLSEQISDPNNFLPLHNYLHKCYDDGYFVYVNNVVKIIVEPGNLLSTLKAHNLDKIPKGYISSRRKIYCEENAKKWEKNHN